MCFSSCFLNVGFSREFMVHLRRHSNLNFTLFVHKDMTERTPGHPWLSRVFEQEMDHQASRGGEGRGGEGKYSPKIWLELCETLLETFALFHHKICDFSLPYFRPDPKFDTLFQTCPGIAAFCALLKKR